MCVMSTDQTAAGYIVLDTNVFCADMHGRGTSTTVLIQGIERLHYSLLVPAIVSDETMMKHRQVFTDAAETYEKSVIALRRFLPPWPKLEFPTITPETSFQRFN